MSLKAFNRAALLTALVFGPSAQAQVAPPPAPPPAGESLGAGWREQQNEARETVQAGRHIPLERVIDDIRRRFPGRLLDTGLEAGPGGRSVYRVRWAAVGGRRLDFLVDAKSGTILATQGK